MSRFSQRLIVAVAAVTLIAAGLTANAQDQRRGQRGGPGSRGSSRGGPGGPGSRGGFGGGPGGASALFLLRSPQVVGELKLTEEQQGKISEAMATMRSSMGQMFAGRQRGEEQTEEQRNAARENFQKAMEKVIAKIKTDVLKPDQTKRLGEIVLWVAGPQALMQENVIKALAITGEQKAKIDAAMQEYRAAMEGLRDLDREARGPAMTKLREQMQAKVKVVVTEEQTAKLKQMMGKPFKLNMQRPQGGGRGRPEGERGRPEGERGRPGGGGRPGGERPA